MSQPARLPPSWFVHTFWRVRHPAWWLNLEANPNAEILMAHDQPRPVHAHRATGEKRERLWQRWREIDAGLDDFSARRTVDTPVVVFEPR